MGCFFMGMTVFFTGITVFCTCRQGCNMKSHHRAGKNIIGGAGFASGRILKRCQRQ